MAWATIVEFLRGTRVRPPPGPKKPRASALLVAAALLHLPLVYLLVRDLTLPPAFALCIGLLAMGLAWSGGVSLEGRRRNTATAIAAIAAAEIVLAFVPAVAASLGSARWLFAGIGALSAGAIATIRR